MYNNTLGIRKKGRFRGRNPTARTFAYLRIASPFLGLAQGLLLAQAGSPLARPDSHRLDDRQSFMETSHPPIPFDQPCLVALLLNPSVMPFV